MSLCFRSGEKVSDSVGLLISMLVRYPEISSIYYEPTREEIKFTFLLNKNTKNIDEFSDLLNKCLRTYNILENGKTLNNVSISYSVVGKITMVEIGRKIKHLSPQELNMIISLIQDYFYDELIVEVEELALEEQLLQEDLIGTILDNLNQETLKQRLIAYREEGRVMVFNE